MAKAVRFNWNRDKRINHESTKGGKHEKKKFRAFFISCFRG